ncbi:MAG: ABC transporter substrate-binding protein, partial [Flavobacterium sp.]|nr:ABC transporter substrate-binding protein [Flavobacterium sp.]
HSPTFNKTLVGYENGLLIVINESDGSVYRAIGIIQKQIPGNVKQINSFYENNGIVYISCKFGIVQFNLNNNEFGDTYFLGAAINDYQEVYQTTILNNEIYAVTQLNGIKKGNLNNPNLNDFSQWIIFDNNYWNGIATINNQIVASNTNNNLYKFTGSTASLFYNNFSLIIDFKFYNNNLIVTSDNKVVVFNDQLVQLAQVNSSTIGLLIQFTCATLIDKTLYMGTQENGVFTTNILNPTVFENITPNCPIRNKVFAINASTGTLWAVYGGYTSDYNPYTYNPNQIGNINKPNKYGYSKFNENGWQNTPYSDTFPATALCKITFNPNNSNQMYFSSFFSGLLKLDNGNPTILYNTTNSGLESLSPSSSDIRINGVAFDKTGNIWVNNSLIEKGLKVFKTNNTWQSINFNGSVASPKDNYYGNIVIDKNNTKWLATSGNGVVAYNENGNVIKIINDGPEKGNLPISDVRVLAIDNKNQLWIGTISGLRIVSSVDAFLSPDQIKSTNIVINEDGLGQELFYEQTIIDIVVDGANRKWVGTTDSGVYLVSPNGQQTIYHFTTANSPLPSNTLLDIDIDPKTGEVYFATDKGMISFKGTSTKASDNLENVYIYPNPVRPDFNDTVKISGLLDKATVKISDIEGNLVHEATSSGGTIEWDTTAFGKYKVASGVYMVFISAADGVETKVKKVMIIR